MKNYVHLFFLLLSITNFHAQDIFEAARKGDIARMETLTNINPDTLTSSNNNGFTPLILAVYRNQTKAVEFLLKHKVDVNVSSPEGTALLGACFKGNFALAELLLDHLADINATNQQGTTALMYAVLSGNADLVNLLLKRGAKKDLKETSGNTALDYAKASRSEKLIALLTD